MPSQNRKIEKILSTLEHTYGQTMLGRLSRKDTPFQVLIATVLSARARDETIEVVAENLFKKYPTPKTLAAAPLDDVKRLVKKSGFYHVKAARIKELARIIHEDHHDQVPQTMEGLVALPGVGRKTAGCVLVYAYGTPAIPVDTHVHRVSNRLGLVKTKNPNKTEEALMKLVPKKQWYLVNDLFVHHGKTVCKPITPLCGECKVVRYCTYPLKKIETFK
jgi:endonuclease III